jgi:hypothetical protein
VLGFNFRATDRGDVFISRDGRHVVTLRARATGYAKGRDG